MPQKCETISYWNPTPYREPRLRASSLPSVWRFATMHPKPYPKPQDKEMHRDSLQDATRGLHVDQHGSLRKERGVRQPCGFMFSSGNGTVNRCPLSILSTNTLRCSNNRNKNGGSNAPTKVSGTHKSIAPSVTTFTSSLVLLSSSNNLENEDSLIFQGEDAEDSLDIWAVIKPGNTKEKIAIFATQKCSGSPIENISAVEATAPEVRTVSMKNKGSWDSDWTVAKRRRRSGNPDKPKNVDSPAPKPDIQRTSQSEDVSPCQVMADEDEAEKTISVVEMVAYLEQRANDQQVSSKPPSLRSTSTVILSKVPLCPQPAEQPEIQVEEGETVRVLDMVAKLESQCLSRQGQRESGDLSRNNSLRRNVGRVLLAGSEPCLQPSRPASPTVNQDSDSQERSSVLDKQSSPSKAPELTTVEISQCSPAITTLQQYECSLIVGQLSSPDVATANDLQSSTRCGKEEPLPGMLFFQPQPLPQPLKENTSLNKELSLNVHDIKPSVETSLSFREDCETDGLDAKQDHQNIVETENDASSDVSRESVPFTLRRLVSHEFLETRFKIQLLLEPQQYMAFLPHHIIIKIFCLLPTKSLAALKCTCHYFKSIIERYGIRPADSRWVSDPRYKDDPCKQCKKRYDLGDVSLCRWHHKPYCQALPYGPGYWMCCRVARKDTPGCNVGLHDNRWVPAFYSINMPIYKKNEI